MAAKQMKVYLNGILLPVPPEKITRSIRNQNKTLTTISGQQINLIRPAGLTEITLSKVLLPNTAYDFMEVSEDGAKMSAAYYLNKLKEFKQSKEPISFNANESEDGLCQDGEAKSYLVTVEDYKITQEAENGRDIEVEIKLRQYVEYGLQSVPVESTTTATNNQRTTKDTEAQTYVVQKGDTLWAIAKKFYGDGSKYPYLVKLNNISNPNSLKVGQVLKIGSKADALASTSASTSSSKGTKTSTATSTTSNSTTEKIGTMGFSTAKIQLEVEKTVKDADIDIQSIQELTSSRPYASLEAAKKDANKGVTAAKTTSTNTSSKLDLLASTDKETIKSQIKLPISSTLKSSK